MVLMSLEQGAQIPMGSMTWNLKSPTSGMSRSKIGNSNTRSQALNPPCLVCHWNGTLSIFHQWLSMIRSMGWHLLSTNGWQTFFEYFLFDATSLITLRSKGFFHTQYYITFWRLFRWFLNHVVNFSMIFYRFLSIHYTKSESFCPVSHSVPFVTLSHQSLVARFKRSNLSSSAKRVVRCVFLNKFASKSRSMRIVERPELRDSATYRLKSVNEPVGGFAMSTIT